MIPPAQRWKIYALGGGLGHLHRSLALGRAAASRGHSIHILTNSRFASHIPWQKELGAKGNLTAIPSTLKREDTIEITTNWIEQIDYDRLVVDTFPRGLGGELANILPFINRPRILVHRNLNVDYVVNYNLEKALGHFDRIILPGETAPFANNKRSRITEPWLIRDADELVDAESARLSLGMDPSDQRPLMIVCSSGLSGEEEASLHLKDQLSGHLDHWCVKLASPIQEKGDLNPWPLLALMNGIDALVGSGGYNTVNEARATGTPLFAKPLPRMYDRQSARLREIERFENFEQLLPQIPKCRPSVVSNNYINGTQLGVDLIEKLKIDDKTLC
jgi:hypothetical protein